MSSFPQSIILPLGLLYEEFTAALSPYPPPVSDFEELIRQIMHQLMMYPYDQVIGAVGLNFPSPDRMCDRTFISDPVRLNKLTIVTASLTASIIAQFQSLRLFEDDRTIPYHPRRFAGPILVLELLTS